MDQTLPAPLPRFQPSDFTTVVRFVELDDSTVRLEGDLASALRLYYRRSGQVRLSSERSGDRLSVTLLIGERGETVVETFVCEASEDAPMLATAALEMGPEAPEAFAAMFERFTDLCKVNKLA